MIDYNSRKLTYVDSLKLECLEEGLAGPLYDRKILAIGT